MAVVVAKNNDAMREALLEARSHLVVLEGHIDKAAQSCDITEVGRAWARATEVEKALRSILPPGSTDDVATTARAESPASKPARNR